MNKSVAVEVQVVELVFVASSASSPPTRAACAHQTHKHGLIQQLGCHRSSQHVDVNHRDLAGRQATFLHYP